MSTQQSPSFNGGEGTHDQQVTDEDVSSDNNTTSTQSLPSTSTNYERVHALQPSVDPSLAQHLPAAPQHPYPNPYYPYYPYPYYPYAPPPPFNQYPNPIPPPPPPSNNNQTQQIPHPLHLTQLPHACHPNQYGLTPIINNNNKRPHSSTIDNNNALGSSIDLIHSQLNEEGVPSAELQNLAMRIMKKCNRPTQNTTEIKTLRDTGQEDNHTLLSIPKTRGANSSNKESQQRYVRRKVDLLEEFMNIVVQESDDEIKMDIMEKFLSNHGLVLFDEDSLLWTPPMVAALRDWVKMSTRAVGRLHQVINHFVPPSLKNKLMPPQVMKILAAIDKEGTVPPKVLELELVISKANNLKKQCIFWYLEEPHRILELLTAKAVLDDAFRTSIDLSHVANVLFAAFGIDRAGSNVTASLRIGNRQDGNSSKYTIPIAQYEEAAETYDNEKATFFHSKCIIGTFLQNFVWDLMQMCIVKIGTSQCECFTFLPIPSKAEARRQLSVTVIGSVSANQVKFPEREVDGNPPSVQIPADVSDVSFRLVVKGVRSIDDIADLADEYDCDDDANTQYVVGCQLLIDSTVIHTQSFRIKMKLLPSNSISVEVLQVSGHGANDTKQTLILMGNKGPASKSSCPDCICPAEKLGQPTELLQRHRDPDCEVIPDFPKREGYYAPDVASARFQDQAFPNQTDAHYMQLNRDCGSQYLLPLLIVPHYKQNGGPLHLTGGTGNHIFDEMRLWIRSKTMSLPWYTKMLEIDQELLPAMLEQFQRPKKDQTPTPAQQRYMALINHSHRLLRTAKAAQSVSSRLQNPPPAEASASTSTEASTRTEASIETWEARRVDAQAAVNNHSNVTGLEHLNMLKNGLEEFQPLLRKMCHEKCKRAKSALEHALNCAIQGVGGTFQPDKSGFDLTSGDLMNVLERFSEIAAVLIKVYPQGHQLHEEVNREVALWSRVAETFLPLAKMMKSQEKIDRDDEKKFIEYLDVFLLAFEAAFPHRKYFNKLHFIMHIPEYIHRWGMYGLMSEESMEAIHQRTEAIRKLVNTMPVVVDRINTIVNKLQAPLKANIASILAELEVKTTEKKRGPQTNKAKRSNTLTVVSSISRVDVMEGNESFVQFTGSNGDQARLPKEWEEYFFMSKAGEVPQSWLIPSNTDEVVVDDDDESSPSVTIEMKKHTAH